MGTRNPPLDGGSGGGGGGGGNPGTGTGSPGAPGLPSGENGGLVPANWYLLVPTQSATTLNSYLGFYDVTNFNDLVDGGSYSYRAEDVGINRVPTVRRVVLLYRDLGLCVVGVTLTGSDDNGAIITISASKQIGNAQPTGRILMALVDITLTAQRPQLTLTRAAGAGQLSIVAVTMIGEIEEVTL